MIERRLREVGGRAGGIGKVKTSGGGSGRWWAKVKRWDKMDGSDRAGDEQMREGQAGQKPGGNGNVSGGGVCERWRCEEKKGRENLIKQQRGVRREETYDLSPAFSSVSSSRLLDLLTVWRTWSTTSDPWRQNRSVWAETDISNQKLTSRCHRLNLH